MAMRVLFKKAEHTTSMLRNGKVITTGIDVYRCMLSNDVNLTAITTSGAAASGYLRIPVSEIDNLISALQKVKEEK